MANQDLYSVLGVARDAPHDEIRKTYRRLARKHHPDVNPGDKAATERFKEVTAAYEVLSDDKKRKLYDEFGDASLRTGFDPERARAYQQQASAGGSPGEGADPFGGAGGFERGGGFEGGGFDFDLGDLFGFGGRAGAPAATRQHSGEDVIARVELDLAQAIKGTELSVDAPTGQPCTTCNGSGESSTVCPTCKGTGKSQVAQGPMRMVAVCRTCGGMGHQPCPACHGAGVLPGTRPVTVRIPPGADQGTRLRVPGLGRPGLRGGPPGDLYIEVHLRPHPYFRRDGLDLTLALPVTLEEAYLGAAVDVPTPEGSVQLKVPPRSQSGQKLRLRGRGVHKDTETGDLYVELQVRLPDLEDAALADAVRAARSAYSRPVRQGISL